ncbi:MAG: hypothetical protein HW420_1372 [Candidatus Nitrosotenuis sp.]|nr:hypothetical protein [Candidatus Nitrosotenuis sp.]
MKEKTPEPFSTHKESKHLLEAVFLKKLMDSYFTMEIEQYLKSIFDSYEKLEATRFMLDHEEIQEIVANYLTVMKWDVQFEAPLADFDDNYMFDLLAKNDEKTIAVKVKADITEESPSQILDQIFNIKSEIKNAKLFLAMNILRFPEIFSNGKITYAVADFAKRHHVGIILVDRDEDGNWKTWLLPAEFLSR